MKINTVLTPASLLSSLSMLGLLPLTGSVIVVMLSMPLSFPQFNHNSLHF